MTGFDHRWEAIHESRRWGQTPNEHLVRFIKRNRDKLGNDALDVGCGAGAQSFFLEDCGFQVIGIDGSLSAILDCNERRRPLMTFLCLDACSLTMGDNLFDLVVDVCCLQHILDPSHITAINEINRVLKPGGSFFSVTAKWDHSTHIADTPMRMMRRNEIDPLYKGCGFATSSIDMSNFSDRNGAAWISHWIIQAKKVV